MDQNFKALVAQAESGDVNAMIKVAGCYNGGMHVEKNDTLAYKYYKMAADHGHIEAHVRTAIHLLFGYGIPKDKKTGVKYLKIGADNGSAFGQYMLGFLYNTGEIGLFGRERKALQYFEMAAKQGHAKSQIELANMIMIGDHNGYTLDDVVFWLSCAYLHVDNAPKESADALTLLNHLVDNGIPGGSEYILDIMNDARCNYPQYLDNPK